MAIAAAATIPEFFPHVYIQKHMSRIVTFRCPVDLLQMIDGTADHYKRSRNSVLLAAMRLFSRQLREKGGSIVPPMEDELLTYASMFPKPESKGGRPPKKKRKKA